MNAIGYVRISTRDQSKYSLDDQIASIKDYCGRYGLDLVALFRDNGECSDTFDRADFRALENFIKKQKGQVRYLIIMYHDRFSRDLAEALLKIRELERKYKLKVLAVDEPPDLDTTDPDVFLQRAFKYLMANQELLSIRKRTRRGIRSAMEAGRYVQKAPIGFVNVKDENGKGTIKIDEAKAPLVEKIFSLYLSGMPFFEIRKEVAKLGFSYTGKSTIQSILGNCVYAGLIRVTAYDKKPEHFVKGIHDAIISESIYWRVQEMMGNKKITKKSQPKEEVPLRGVLKCWCGLHMTAGWSKGKTKYYLYYRCVKHTNINIPGHKLHEQFREVMKSLSFEEEDLTYLKTSAEKQMQVSIEEQSKTLDSKLKQLKEIEKKILRLEEKMMNDEIQASTYKKWFSKYSDERGSFIQEIEDLKGNNRNKWDRLNHLLKEVTDLQAVYDSTDLKGKHMLVNGVFKHGISYSENMFRTPVLHPAFLLNELKIKKKGLLSFEQSKTFYGQIPLGSPARNRT